MSTDRHIGSFTTQRSSGWAAVLSLFSSTSTLLCCALPALLVALGAGAALSSLIAAVPQLVIVSEHKEVVFGFATVMLAASGWLQWRNRFAPCPTDPALREACTRTRRVSLGVYGVSVLLYTVGGGMAFVLPWWRG